MKPLNRFPLWLFVLLAAVPALADVDPERIEDEETGWYYYSNVTEAQINDLATNQNARLIDIEIHSSSPLRFTAAYVKNSGDYASGWWWYYAATIADVNNLLTAHNARLIDIERYIDGAGNERFAVIMVPNTGAQSKSWWYYAGITTAQISSFLSTNDARLTDIESYDTSSGRRYAVIMIRNAGEDAAGWGWFHNTDLATITNYMNNNNMRILEFEVRDPTTPRFDAILISRNFHTPQTWWWYYNVPFSDIGGLAAQAGARIVDIDRYEVGGNSRFNLVLLNNSSALTVQMGEILDWGRDGDTGVYLREINGSTLASLQPDFQFEPASTIKATHHLHAMRDVMAGNISLATPVTYSINYNGSCPIGGAPTTTQTLQETLRRMMVNSDNAATQGIRNLYGLAAITNTAQNIAGMTSTSINHTLGCGSDAFANPNQLTLRNAGELYERIETLQILDEPTRDTYYSLMQNQDTPSPWWFTTNLEDLVDEVAIDLGIPDAAGSYWTNVRTAWKPGGYTLPQYGSQDEFISVAGIVSLPTCARTGTSIRYRDYVFGVFVHGGLDNSTTINRVTEAAKELFRGAVAQGLASCPSSVIDLPAVATDGLLEPAFPNPFNPSTQLSFSLDRGEEIRLSVYDSAGRLTAIVTEGFYGPGRHEMTWHGRDDSGRRVSSGIYFAQLKMGNRVETQKMALIK